MNEIVFREKEKPKYRRRGHGRGRPMSSADIEAVGRRVRQGLRAHTLTLAIWGAMVHLRLWPMPTSPFPVYMRRFV